MKHATALLLAAAFAAAPCFAAPPPAPTALRADHPLIGAWKITTHDGSCSETYRIDRSGTTLVTSAEEVAETRFTLSDQPSAKGYYKWVDTLVKDNGKTVFEADKESHTQEDREIVPNTDIDPITH